MEGPLTRRFAVSTQACRCQVEQCGPVNSIAKEPVARPAIHRWGAVQQRQQLPLAHQPLARLAGLDGAPFQRQLPLTSLRLDLLVDGLLPLPLLVILILLGLNTAV